MYIEGERKIVVSLKYIQNLQNENSILRGELDKLKAGDYTLPQNKRLREYSGSESDDKRSKSPNTDILSKDGPSTKRKPSVVAGSTTLTAFGDEINHILPKANINFSEIDILNVTHSSTHNVLFKNGDQFILEAKRPGLDPYRVHLAFPSYELALEYLEAFDLFLGRCFYFFNVGRFKHQLYTTYFSQAAEMTVSSDQVLHFVTFLLVFAMGKMYHAGQGKDPDVTLYKSFPGLEYFYTATNIINFAFHDLQTRQSNVDNVQALLLYSFYHQVIDASSGHYILSGTTVRTALAIGMHKTSKNTQSRYEQEHSRRLWWTLYGVDRYCSSKCGFPLSIPDDIITTELPANIPESAVRDVASTYDSFPDSVYMTHYILLSRIFSSMISRLYQPKTHVDIIPVMLSILAEVHQWQNDLPDVLKVDYTKENLKISRVITNIHSEYFWCINLTIRPVLLSFVRKRLRSGRTKRAPVDLSKFSKDIITLLNASLQASIQTLRSHNYLLSISQLAKFGYLDREYIYSAISTLVLFNVAFGVNAAASQQIDVGLLLLQEMEKVGNKNAAQRREQSVHLIQTFEKNGIPIHPPTPVYRSTKDRLPSISHSPAFLNGQQPDIVNRSIPSMQVADHNQHVSGSTVSPHRKDSDKKTPNAESPLLKPGSTFERNQEMQQLPSISRLQHQAYDDLGQYGNVSLPPPSPQGMAPILSSWSPSPTPLVEPKNENFKPPVSPIYKHQETPALPGTWSTGTSPERYSQNFMLLDQNGPDMFDHGVLGNLSSFGLTSDALGLPINLFDQDTGALLQRPARVGMPGPNVPGGSDHVVYMPAFSDHSADSPRSGSGSVHPTTTQPPQGYTAAPHMPSTTTSAPVSIPHAASSSHERTGSFFSTEQEQNLWNEVTNQSLLWFGTVPDEFRNAPFGS